VPPDNASFTTDHRHLKDCRALLSIRIRDLALNSSKTVSSHSFVFSQHAFNASPGANVAPTTLKNVFTHNFMNNAG
jgi:hypothetical protein